MSDRLESMSPEEARRLTRDLIAAGEYALPALKEGTGGRISLDAALSPFRPRPIDKVREALRAAGCEPCEAFAGRPVIAICIDKTSEYWTFPKQ